MNRLEIGVFNIEEGGRLRDAEGHTYVYDRQWENVSRDGKNILEYHFNKRRWNYIEDLAVTTSPILADRIDKDLIERIYQRENGVLTASTQGKNPLLTYKDGKYFNEFGEHVYSVYGNFPEWTTIVMLHRYYLETFNGDDVDEYMARRAAAAEVFANSNSLATDILQWSTKYESRNKKKEVMYFAEADGEVFVLTDDQLQQVRNGWLTLNEKPKMMSWPHYIPEASFTLSKGKAKKRGVQGVKSGSFVLELKLVPEYMAEFREAVSP